MILTPGSILCRWEVMTDVEEGWFLVDTQDGLKAAFFLKTIFN